MDGGIRGGASRRLRIPWKVLVPTVAALGAGGAVAAAAVPGSSGVITACYATNSYDNSLDEPIGALRIIDPSDTTDTTPGANSCVPGEATVTWNQQGPPGAPGQPGQQGQQGQQGEQGQQGQTGQTGQTGSQGPAGPAGTMSATSGSGTDVIMELTPSNPGLGALQGESQVSFTNSASSSPNQVFKVTSFDLGAMMSTNVGSQSSGAGAGKVQFQKFVITKPVDRNSSNLFLDMAKGTALKSAEIIVRKTTANGQVIPVAQYLMKLVAITDIHISGTPKATTETIQGEYGAIQFVYYQQQQNGTTKVGSAGGWNRVTNTSISPSIFDSVAAARRRRG